MAAGAIMTACLITVVIVAVNTMAVAVVVDNIFFCA